MIYDIIYCFLKIKKKKLKQKAYRKVDVSLYNDLLSAWQTLFWHFNKFALQQWQNICQKILFLAQISQASYSTNRIALFRQLEVYPLHS